MGAQVRFLPAEGPARAEGPGPPAVDPLSVPLAPSHQPMGLSYRGVRRHPRAVPPGLAASPSLGSPAVCPCSEQRFEISSFLGMLLLDGGIFCLKFIIIIICVLRVFPGGASGKELAYQCRRHKSLAFDPWVGKIP